MPANTKEKPTLATSASDSPLEAVMTDPADATSCCGGQLDAGNPNRSACDIPSRSGSDIGPTLSLFLIGAAGNLLALLVLLRRRPRPNRRARASLFYSLLTALIAADLLAQLFTSSAPLAVYSAGVFNSSARRLRLVWIGGELACQAHGVVMTTVSLGEPLLVLCMSIERLLCLANRRRRRNCRMTRWLPGLLSAALLVACLPLAGLGAYRLQYPATWCFVDSHSPRPADRAFAAGLALWNLAIIGLIVACNLWVIWRLLSVRRVRKAMLRPGGGGGGCGQINVNQMSNGDSVARDNGAGGKASFPGSGRPKYMRAMEVQLLVILIAITASFALCWSPLMIRLVLNSLLSSTDCIRDLSAVRLASINQILDPWLYILLRKSNFQRVWRLIRQVGRCGKSAAGVELGGSGGWRRQRQRRQPPSALLLRRRSPASRFHLAAATLPQLQAGRSEQQQQLDGEQLLGQQPQQQRGRSRSLPTLSIPQSGDRSVNFYSAIDELEGWEK